MGCWGSVRQHDETGASCARLALVGALDELDQKFSKEGLLVATRDAVDAATVNALDLEQLRTRRSARQTAAFILAGGASK